MFPQYDFLKSAAFSCERECLAGESGAEDVEIVGNELLGFFFGDVAEGNFAVVGFVGFGGLGVPLGGENAFAAEVLHGDAETADSGEKVNEGEFRFFRRRERDIEEFRKKDL